MSNERSKLYKVKVYNKERRKEEVVRVFSATSLISLMLAHPEITIRDVMNSEQTTVYW